VPRQLGTTLEGDDGIVRIGRAGGVRRSGSAPLVGAGIGLAFVTATVAALAGVAEHDAGLASGLSNTALQTGTALGVAIVTTVAVSAPSTTWQRTNARTRSPR
jgi:hypothetical protein